MSELVFDEDRGLGGEWRHSCPGMDRFLGEGGGCEPELFRGHVSACDGTNPIALVYCPFCAEKLPEHDSADCSDCKFTRAYMDDLRSKPVDNVALARAFFEATSEMVVAEADD